MGSLTVTELLDARGVTPAPDQEAMKAHLRCRWCEPVWRLGMSAMCGEKMLGISLPKRTPVGCAECDRLWEAGHVEECETRWAK